MAERPLPNSFCPRSSFLPHQFSRARIRFLARTRVHTFNVVFFAFTAFTAMSKEEAKRAWGEGKKRILPSLKTI